MKSDTLRQIHDDVSKCNRCMSILGVDRIIPRSGFPPENAYDAMIIGAEPGPGARSPLTPYEYKEKFRPGCGGTNKARLIFEDIDSRKIAWEQFFFTNTVKCPATKSQSKQCFPNCSEFLSRQVHALRPKFIVVLGRACSALEITKPRQDQILHLDFLGFPVLSICHPQGASCEYRNRVIDEIERLLHV